jgi:hypothetical protein
MAFEDRAVFFSDGDEGAPPRRTLDGLERVTDPSVGAWLVASMTTFAESVASLLPGHFEAYARVFPPISHKWLRHAEPVTWRTLAAAAGLEFNERTDCHALLDLNRDELGSRFGDLNPALMDPLIEHLAPATSARGECYFALWEGYAGSIPYETAEPTLLLPHRKYHVFRGAIDAVHVSFQQYFGDKSANLWWPADHAWCVATEVDLYATYVGGPRACLDALLADPRVESVETFAKCDRW